TGGQKIEIGGRERTVDAPDARGVGYLEEFRLEAGLPIWRYQADRIVIEKRVFLPHRQNTVHVRYELRDGADEVELALRPSINFRAQESPVREPIASYEFHANGDDYEIHLKESRLPSLRLKVFAENASFTLKEKRIQNILYPVEESRGYQATGELCS